MEPALRELSRTQYSDLQQEVRIDVGKAICELLNSWKVKRTVQIELLGLGPARTSSLALLKRGEPLEGRQDFMERVVNLFGIHLALRVLYPLSPSTLNGWVQFKFAAMSDTSPLQQMIDHGLPGIIAVREYLDMMAGRSPGPHVTFSQILATQTQQARDFGYE